MENVIALKVFRDKDDSSLHLEGEEFKLSNDRAAELSEKGYVKIMPSVPETKPEKLKPTTKEEKAKPETKEEKKFE